MYTNFWKGWHVAQSTVLTLTPSILDTPQKIKSKEISYLYGKTITTLRSFLKEYAVHLDPAPHLVFSW